MNSRLRIAADPSGSASDVSGRAPDDRRLYDADEVGRLFGISRKMVYVLVERGELGCYRVGRRIRFSPAQLNSYLRSVEQEAG